MLSLKVDVDGSEHAPFSVDLAENPMAIQEIRAASGRMLILVIAKLGSSVNLEIREGSWDNVIEKIGERGKVRVILSTPLKPTLQETSVRFLPQGLSISYWFDSTGMESH